MEIALQFVLLALGFVMLGKGADWFVEGAAGNRPYYRGDGHERTGGSGKYRCCS